MVLRDTSGSRIAFTYGAVTLSGGPFQATSANEPICNSLWDPQFPPVGPTTPRLQRLRPITQPRFGLLRFRSPLLTECSLFLEVLRCFSSLGVLATAYIFNRASLDITPGGFPHSDISGSTLARNSPKHFAACHVLRRLLAPRHPPHALSSLTYSVHAASTVLAATKRLRSRRKILDEIDASTLRLIRPVAQAPRRAVRKTDVVSGACTQRSRGRPSAVSPREPAYFTSRPEHGQPNRGPAVSPLNCARLKRRLAPEGVGVSGGDEGTRTPDPLLAKEVLSQLSYIPTGTRIVANGESAQRVVP